MSADPDYLPRLQNQGVAHGLAQLRALALEFGGVLSAYPKLNSDLDRIIVSLDSSADSVILVAHIESQLAELAELDHRMNSLSESVRDHNLIRKAVEQCRSLTSLRNVSLCLSELKQAIESSEYVESRLDAASALRAIIKTTGLLQELVTFESPRDDDPKWCWAASVQHNETKNDEKIYRSYQKLADACVAYGDDTFWRWLDSLRELHDTRPAVGQTLDFKAREREIVNKLFSAFKIHVYRICEYNRFKQEHLPRFVAPALVIDGQTESGDRLYDLLIISFERSLKQLADVSISNTKP